MGFAIYKEVGCSWGEVYNMGFVVYKGVRKCTNFEAKFWLFKEHFPNANMLQTMMHIRESPHLYQQRGKGSG